MADQGDSALLSFLVCLARQTMVRPRAPSPDDGAGGELS